VKHSTAMLITTATMKYVIMFLMILDFLSDNLFDNLSLSILLITYKIHLSDFKLLTNSSKFEKLLFFFLFMFI